MLNEEIFILTKHGKFQAEYIENIPIFKRRYFLHLLNKEFEKTQEEIDKAKRNSNS